MHIQRHIHIHKHTHSGCNAPEAEVNIFSTIQPTALQCYTNNIMESIEGFRTGSPLHAALTANLINNIADRAMRSKNGDNTVVNSPMTAGIVPQPGLVNCSRYNWTRGADACVSMVWHNYNGTNLSVPVWGCMARHMEVMGLSCTVADTPQVRMYVCRRVFVYVRMRM